MSIGRAAAGAAIAVGIASLGGAVVVHRAEAHDAAIPSDLRSSIPLAPPAVTAPMSSEPAPSVPTPPTTVADPAGAPAPTTPMLPPVAVVVGGQTAPVVAVGVLPDGELQLPARPTIVGWWADSSPIGAPTGAVVIAGHVDSHRYGLGTFAVLRDLRTGDEIDLVDSAGRTHRYLVSSEQQTAKSALPADLVGPDGPARLVLITCTGAFDSRTRHYADNLIVIATPA